MNQATIPTSKPTESKKHLELKVESPVPGPEHANSWFTLYIPQDLDWKEDFDTIARHIEFRRKCMNQGFDNLLELLTMTRDTIEKDLAAKAEKENKPAE